MSWIDAHCHLADPRFDGQREAVLARARARGINCFIQGGVDPADWARQRALGPGCVPCFGLHPWFVGRATPEACAAALQALEACLHEAVGLGELGLDFSARMDPLGFTRQRTFFAAQLHLAQAHQKPLVLHLVACHGEAPELLAAIAPRWRGLVHGFTGSAEVARAYLKLGLHLSVGGAVARTGYKKLKRAVRDIPKDRLVVESDAPDMAPAPYQRPLNEPESIHIVAEAVAQIRGEAPEAVLADSAANVRRIFDLEAFP